MSEQTPFTQHHAHVLSGGHDVATERLHAIITEDFGLTREGNPDVVELSYDVFGVDDARYLQHLASQRAVYGVQILCVQCNAMTLEAQNALLKLFEEPAPHTHFFLTIPDPALLLPTMRSRVMLHKLDDASGEGSDHASEFLAASPAQRLELMQKLIADKDKQKALYFIDSLETYLYAKKHVSQLPELLVVRRYLRGRSPSVKLILEHLSMVLPRLEKTG